VRGRGPDLVHVALLDAVRLEDVVLAPDDLFLSERVFEREDGGQFIDLDADVAARFFQEMLVRVREQEDGLFG
jgi:hypothetical protein